MLSVFYSAVVTMKHQTEPMIESTPAIVRIQAEYDHLEKKTSLLKRDFK